MKIRIQKYVGFGSTAPDVFESKSHNIKEAIAEALAMMSNSRANEAGIRPTDTMDDLDFNLFSGHNLTYLDLSCMRLAGEDLSNLRMSFTPDFSEANCKGMNFSNSTAIGAHFVRTNCQKINLTNADVRGSRFDEADLRDAIWAGAKIRGATFYDAKMDKAGLIYALHNGARLFKNPIQNFIVSRKFNRGFHLTPELKKRFCR